VVLDDFFICDACDEASVPDPERSFGAHTEEHDLIRCLQPKELQYEVPAAEKRLTAIEDCLDRVQVRLDDLTSRMGELTGRMEDLSGRMGDLTRCIGDLNSQTGNIEQLLRRLAGLGAPGDAA